MKKTCYLLMLIAAVSCVCKAENTDMVELPFSIDSRYTVTRMTKNSLPSPIPGAKPTSQVTVEVTRNTKKARIFYWDGPPLRDLGPMVEKESWPAEFLGTSAAIARTSLFMGQKQEVLVLHCKLSDYASVMIYSTDMTRDEFNDLLAHLRLE